MGSLTLKTGLRFGRQWLSGLLSAGANFWRAGLSRLRELAHHPLAAVALVHALLVFLVTAWFAVSRDLELRPAVLMLSGALPLGGLFGVVISGFDRLLLPAADFLRRRTPPVTAGFLLFFAYLLGYALLFTGLVAWPLSLVAGEGPVEPTPSLDFRLFSMNFILLFALLSWLGAKRRLGGKLAGLLRPWREKIRSKETP